MFLYIFSSVSFPLLCIYYVLFRTFSWHQVAWAIRVMPNLYLIIMYVLINSTNDKQHKFWLVEGFFSQVRSDCLTDHRPQAVFSISENNRIGFPAFRGAAARQNEWKWLLATFATFSEKCKSIQRVTNFSVVSEQKQVRMSRTLNGITKERLEKTSFLKKSCFMWSGI